MVVGVAASVRVLLRMGRLLDRLLHPCLVVGQAGRHVHRTHPVRYLSDNDVE